MQPVTVRDIQVEAKLRRPTRHHSCCLAIDPLSKFPRRQGEPRINDPLGQTFGAPQHRNRNFYPQTIEAKKLIALRLRANGIRSWASFNLSRGIGIEVKKLESGTARAGTQSSNWEELRCERCYSRRAFAPWRRLPQGLYSPPHAPNRSRKMTTGERSRTPSPHIATAHPSQDSNHS